MTTEHLYFDQWCSKLIKWQLSFSQRCIPRALGKEPDCSKCPIKLLRSTSNRSRIEAIHETQKDNS